MQAACMLPWLLIPVFMASDQGIAATRCLQAWRWRPPGSVRVTCGPGWRNPSPPHVLSPGECNNFYISAAQRALLNPNTAADLFAKEADRQASVARSAGGDSAAASAGGDDGDEAVDELKFTRNVVVLEITGADVDLALIDLPGIIQTVDDDDDASSVELVKQLVDDYISSDRAIITATISCKDDIDNQAILRMARAADKEGTRTIGVLTKADTIEPGTHKTWLPVLRGERYKLELGYFCLVNPSQADLDNNMTAADAAAKEAKFFKEDSFWSQQPPGRFGVNALRSELSKQLVSLTQRELPKMKLALEEAIEQAEKQIHALPRPPASDAKLELSRRLRELSAQTKAEAEGEGSVAFFRAVDKCYDQLRVAVLRARPTVRLTGDATAASASSSSSLADEESPEFWLRGPEQPASSAGQPAAEPDGLITLETARQLAAQFRVAELPSFAPYRALDELVQGLKGRWDRAAQACVREVGEALEKLCDRLVNHHFGQFSAARQEIRSRLYELHAEILEETTLRVTELMAMERQQVWTQNSHYLTDSKHKFLTMLQKQLYGRGGYIKGQQACSNGASVSDNIQSGLVALNAAGLGLTADDIEALVARKRQKVQQDEGLLQIIAGALAYIKVSSKRVIDGVPMHFNHYLLRRWCTALEDLAVGFVAGLPDAAADATAAADNDDDETGADEQPVPSRLSAAELMAEDKLTAQRRAQLQRQLEQLQAVRKILSVF